MYRMAGSTVRFASGLEKIMDDELRPEYDLKSLSVRRLGPDRKSFGGSVVRLEPDDAEAVPDADSAKENESE